MAYNYINFEPLIKMLLMRQLASAVALHLQNCQGQFAIAHSNWPCSIDLYLAGSNKVIIYKSQVVPKSGSTKVCF